MRSAALTRERAPLRGRSAAIAALAVSLLATAVSFAFLYRDARETDRRRLHDSVGFVTQSIERRFDVYFSALEATHAHLDATGSVHRADFEHFVAAQELPERYPGIQGVGFSQWIPRAQLEAHLARERREYGASYRVWPPGEREHYSSIIYLSPQDTRNLRAIGYDMFTDPVRRAAMEASRDTGEIRASGVVRLVQESGPPEATQPGFLLFRAIYDGDPRTLEERRANLLGWAYSPFRAHDFFRGIFPEPHPTVDFEIFDGEPTPETELFDFDRVQRTTSGEKVARLSERTTLQVAGRRWTILFYTLPAFELDSPRRQPYWVLGGGLLVSALLFVLARWQAEAREEAEQAEQRATFLANAGELLSKSLDYATTLRHVAELAVPSIGDWCSIDLRNEQGTLANVATTHWDPAKVQFVEELRQKYPADPNAPGGVNQVLRSGQPVLIREIPDELLVKAARGEDHLQLIRGLGLVSYMSVPLHSRDEAIGVISFATSTRGRLFGRDDLALAQDLARLAAAAVDNARLYRRSQELVALRDDFLSIAAHELRTPLTSLRLKLQLLRRYAGDPSTPPGRLDEAIVGVDRQATRLGRLVEGLLDMSRIASGRLKLELERVDLAEVVREVALRMGEEAATMGSTIDVEAPPALAGTWDLMRVEQVLTNLVSNAIKYGGGKPIRIVLGGDEHTTTIKVIDQGIGIAGEAMKRLFHRFERAVSVRHYGGLGLGLYITRQIVEALGGQIEVTSKEGEGSTFTVTLPRHARADAGSEAPN